ncbi:MAG: hypothetical protein BGP13_20850 [Sphingobacteriales bacterium 40-81]|nr:MAG: hypothetical protein BGP13_20850 [Sphingobacteriales bacterium 40-81]
MDYHLKLKWVHTGAFIPVLSEPVTNTGKQQVHYSVHHNIGWISGQTNFTQLCITVEQVQVRYQYSESLAAIQKR